MKIGLPPFPISGGCACGAVRYRLNAPPLSVYACHCLRCQKYTGSFTLSMLARRADVEFSGAEPVEHHEPADSGRMSRIFFCPTCHTRVWHVPADHGLLAIMAGTLDDTSWLAPAAHIWTRYKQPGARIEEGTPCFEGPPPSRELLYEAFRRAVRAAAAAP